MPTTTTRLATTADLPAWAVWLACALTLVSLAMLVVEMRRRGGGAILATGIVALAALLLAVLRPVRIAARESVVGPRVVVLADTSRSMALAGDGSGPRRETRDAVIAQLVKEAATARIATFGFAEGTPKPFSLGGGDGGDASARGGRSDLAAAIRAVAAMPEERPAAIVVVSDGRLDDPPEGAARAALADLGETLRAPVHTIATTRRALPDASVRRVGNAGAAVAHVPSPSASRSAAPAASRARSSPSARASSARTALPPCWPRAWRTSRTAWRRWTSR